MGPRGSRGVGDDGGVGCAGSTSDGSGWVDGDAVEWMQLLFQVLPR
jgi:hypothetical protein